MEETQEGEVEGAEIDLRAKFKGKDIWSSILKDQEVKDQTGTDKYNGNPKTY